MEETIPIPVTTTRLMRPSLTFKESSGQAELNGALRWRAKQSDAHVGDAVDPPPVRLQPAVGNREIEFSPEYPPHINAIDDPANCRQDLIFKTDFSHAEGAAAAGKAKPS